MRNFHADSLLLGPMGFTGPQGDTGTQGYTGATGANPQWNFIGVWNPNYALYTVGDIVTHLGSTYYCIAYTGDYENPADTNKWTLIAEGGNIAYTPSTSSHWASPAPTTIFQAINRIAAAVYGLLSDTPIP